VLKIHLLLLQLNQVLQMNYIMLARNVAYTASTVHLNINYLISVSYYSYQMKDKWHLQMF